MNEKKNVLKDKSFGFALKCIAVFKYLTDKKKEFVMSKQLLRSGTSVGANIREAQNAESNADFIYKLGIAQKECDESLYWLELLHASGYIEKNLYQDAMKATNEILRMLKSSILTIKQKNINKR
jgi:four helix bundle protein